MICTDRKQQKGPSWAPQPRPREAQQLPVPYNESLARLPSDKRKTGESEPSWRSPEEPDPQLNPDCLVLPGLDECGVTPADASGNRGNSLLLWAKPGPDSQTFDREK